MVDRSDDREKKTTTTTTKKKKKKNDKINQVCDDGLLSTSGPLECESTHRRSSARRFTFSAVGDDTSKAFSEVRCLFTATWLPTPVVERCSP